MVFYIICVDTSGNVGWDVIFYIVELHGTTRLDKFLFMKINFSRIFYTVQGPLSFSKNDRFDGISK